MTLIALSWLAAAISAAGVVALARLACADDRARPVGRARSHVRLQVLRQWEDVE